MILSKTYTILATSLSTMIIQTEERVLVIDLAEVHSISIGTVDARNSSTGKVFHTTTLNGEKIISTYDAPLRKQLLLDITDALVARVESLKAKSISLTKGQ